MMGPIGPIGPAGPLVFSFSGSTGTSQTANFIGGASTCWSLSGTNTAPVSSSSGWGDLSTLYVPAGTSCSSMSFIGTVSTVPSGFVGLGAMLVVYKNATALGTGGVGNWYSLCEFNPNAAGGGTGSGVCTGTVNTPISPNDQLAICLRASYATPPQTRAAWSLRCTAQ